MSVIQWNTGGLSTVWSQTFRRETLHQIFFFIMFLEKPQKKKKPKTYNKSIFNNDVCVDFVFMTHAFNEQRDIFYIIVLFKDFECLYMF